MASKEFMSYTNKFNRNNVPMAVRRKSTTITTSGVRWEGEGDFSSTQCNSFSSIVLVM